MWTVESFAELLKRHGCSFVSVEKWNDRYKKHAEKHGIKLGNYDSMTIDGHIDAEALVAELNKEITKHW